MAFIPLLGLHQNPNADGVNVYGGGKLGIYSYWPSVPASPTHANVTPSLTQPAPGNAQQFEYYDYSGSFNYPEVGNEWLSNPVNSAAFLAAFNNTSVQNELYPPDALTTSKYNMYYQDALYRYAVAANNATCAAPALIPLDNDENLD